MITFEKQTNAITLDLELSGLHVTLTSKDVERVIEQLLCGHIDQYNHELHRYHKDTELIAELNQKIDALAKYQGMTAKDFEQ